MLTDLACRKATPRATAYKLADSRGLYLEVLASGYRSWRWKYRFGKKEKRLVFGPYPEISLSEARELREEAARLLRQGIDPAVAKKQREAELVAKVGSTFEAIARDWHASQKRAWSERYARLVMFRFDEDVFPKIGRLPITDITPPMILEVLRRVEARGSLETARRLRQRISEVFIRAIAGGVATNNPAAGMEKALARPRKGQFPAVRSIKAAQDVLTKTEAQPGHPLTKLASRLLALTAVRPGVLRLAAPEEFENLDGKEPIWRIPPAKMKLVTDRKADAAYEFIVPLSRQAVETVKVAMAFSEGGPLIFRSVRHPRRPLSDSTLSKAYRDAGYSGVHVPHGWRATFSTIMNELAADQDRIGDRAIIDLMLAHVPDGVEPLYNRAAYMPRRRAIAQEWADLLTEGLRPPHALVEGRRRT